MRKLNGLLASSFLIIAAFAVIGCSNDDPADPYGNQSVLSGTIAGSGWAAVSPLGVRSLISGQIFVGVFGEDAQDRRITIEVTGLTGPGTFTVGNGTITANIELDLGTQVWNGLINGATGSVIITTLTTTYMTGSFSGTLQPVPGTNATGTRTVSGTFTAYFGQT